MILESPTATIKQGLDEAPEFRECSASLLLSGKPAGQGLGGLRNSPDHKASAWSLCEFVLDSAESLQQGKQQA